MNFHGKHWDFIALEACTRTAIPSLKSLHYHGSQLFVKPSNHVWPEVTSMTGVSCFSNSSDLKFRGVK